MRINWWQPCVAGIYTLYLNTPHAPTEAIWNTGSRQQAVNSRQQISSKSSKAEQSGAEQSTQKALTKRTTNEANYFSNSRRRYAMRCDTSTFTNFKQMTADESYFNDLAVAKNRLHTAQAKAQAQRQRRRRRAELLQSTSTAFVWPTAAEINTRPTHS